MKNRNNKKGFTIVELVIVIAVIAILAAVLIPTFSNLVSKANESKAIQEADNALKADLIDAEGDYENINSTFATANNVTFKGTYDSANKTYTYGGYTYTFATGAWEKSGS